jgi:ABC-type transport system involved in cytochrome c biogenesis permease subunit
MDKLVGLLAVAMALTLVLRSYRSQRVPMNSTVTLILMWVLIITVLTLIFSRMGADLPR